MRDFLIVSFLVTMAPAAALALVQFSTTNRWMDAIVAVLAWMVFPLCYWWPIGLWLMRGKPRWYARVPLGYLLSVPLYFSCLFVVYAMLGFRFNPTESSWPVYLSVSPWFFLYTVALWLLVHGAGRLARTTRVCAIALFTTATIAPVAAIVAADEFSLAADAPAPLRILNARIVDTLSGAIVEGKEVHLTDGVISAVVDAADGAGAPDANAVDAHGAFLVPGLIDVHVHVQAPVRGLGIPFSVRYMIDELFGGYPDHRRQFLAHGITSVRDVGGAAAVSRELARELAAGKLAGPRLFTVGRLVTSPTGHPISTIWTPQVAAAGAIRADDAAMLASEIERDIASMQPDALKVVYGTIGRAPTRLSEDLLAVAARVAGRHRLPVIVHAERVDEIAAAARHGATGIEHVASMEDLPDWLAALLQRHRPFVDATFGEYRVVLAQNGTTPATIDAMLERARTMIKRLFDAGVPIVVGTDAPLVQYGAGLHDELRELRRAGLSPAQVLHSATVNNAAYLGQAKALGRVAEGFKADMVLVRENPLEDLDTLRTPVWTMVDGVIMWHGE